MTLDYQYQDMVAREADPYAQAKYDIILNYCQGKGPLRILNAGCGSGELSFRLAGAGNTVVGIDPGADYIALAQKRCPAEIKARCAFYVSSIENYFSAAPFDCIIATDVLEHIADDVAAFSKLAGMLRPNGNFIITVPAMPALFGFHDEQLGHYRRYTRRSLRQLLAAAPTLNIERLRYFGFTLIPVCWWFSRFRRQPYPIGALGKPARLSVLKIILRWLLAFDKRIALPFGTSLILIGKKRI